MIQKKICMLGSFSVGKTSLVKCYITGIYDEKYQTTVGVKIDKKQIVIDDKQLMLMLWDMAGEDEFSLVRPSHLRGMSGCVLVIDGTRKQSYEVALSIYRTVREQCGEVPVIFALNKADLKDKWVLDDVAINSLMAIGPVLETSAKQDENVEALFMDLGRQLL